MISTPPVYLHYLRFTFYSFYMNVTSYSSNFYIYILGQNLFETKFSCKIT